MPTAIVFPGQGSQTPDMRDRVLARRPDLLQAAERLIGADPFARVAQSTRYAQPAIFCASLTGLDELRALDDCAAGFTGHSLGEVAALVAGEAISEADGLRLVVRRAELMAQAGERAGKSGAMLAVLGADAPTVAQEARRCTVVVANDNAPGQVVLSGTRGGLLMVSDRLRAHGARTLMLDVGGAFHSPFMADAVEPFREFLAGVDISTPRHTVWSSTAVRPFADDRDVRDLLASALVRPVRWRETVEAIAAAGVDRFVEAGPGRVLARLVRRTLPDVEALSAERLEAARA